MDKPAIEQFQEMHDAIMDLRDEIAKAMKERERMDKLRYCFWMAYWWLVIRYDRMKIDRYNFGLFYAFYDGDGYVEIIERKNRFRALLFWPPAFSLITHRFVLTWNVDKRLWFRCFAWDN